MNKHSNKISGRLKLEEETELGFLNKFLGNSIKRKPSNIE